MEQGADQIGMGRQGKKRMKLIIKEKRNIVLVYATDLPVYVQGFWTLVIANVDGHMWITGRRMWVERELV